MIPAIINELHMFKDGNGRTSRVIYALLSSENEESFNAELEKALSSDGRFDSYDIDPSIISHKIEQEVLKKHEWFFDEGENQINHKKSKKVASTEFNKISNEDKDFFENIKKYQYIYSSDFRYVMTAIIESLTDEKYKEILFESRLIWPEKMKILNNEDWKKIFNTYYELKKEQVRMLIDVFVNPNNYKNPDNSKETLKDYFIRKIEENHERNK